MNNTQGSVSSDHVLVYLKWRRLIFNVYLAMNVYKTEQTKFVTHLAVRAWKEIRCSDDVKYVFPLIHSKCCNGSKLACKTITSDTETKVILMLDQMYQDESYAEHVVSEHSNEPDNSALVTRAKKKIKKLQGEVDVFALLLIRNYMRMAIWKEHLCFPLTLLEHFLCCKEGISALGLGCVSGVWTLYGNLKKLPIFCYKRRVCRQCFSESSSKWIACKKCECVYFCKQGSCISNAREDKYFGHTEDECALFKAKRDASNQICI